MKLTENTKVRIKVPKHMYESIQAELAKKHEMDEAYHEDNMEEEKVEEDVMTGAQIDAEALGKIANIDPFLAGVLLVGAVATGVVAGPKIAEMAKIALQVAKDKGSNTLAKVKNLFKKKKIDTGAQPVAEEVDEMEETLDLESLMEAVKDLSKKKAEDKKKKEAEAKKKADAKKK